MTHMRVAMVGPTYPHRGGIVHYTHALVAALSRIPETDVELHSYAKLFPKLLYKGGSYSGTQAFALQGVPVHKFLTYGGPRSWRRAARAMRGADVIHFQTWTPFLSPSMIAVARSVPGSTLVATVHNVVPHERLHRVLTPATRMLLGKMDAVIVHSSSLVDDVAKKLRVERPRIHVVPHGPYGGFDNGRFARAEARKRLGLAENEVALLQFGIIRDYKGLDIALEALALLPPTYKLVIAGECWDPWKRYQTIIDKHGLADRVVPRLGYVPDDEVELYFRAADVAIYPYRRLEAQSGAAMTASAFGVPVVTTGVGGLNDIPGTHVAPEDPRSLAAAILAPQRSAASPTLSWGDCAGLTRSVYDAARRARMAPAA